MITFADACILEMKPVSRFEEPGSDSCVVSTLRPRVSLNAQTGWTARPAVRPALTIERGAHCVQSRLSHFNLTSDNGDSKADYSPEKIN